MVIMQLTTSTNLRMQRVTAAVVRDGGAPSAAASVPFGSQSSGCVFQRSSPLRFASDTMADAGAALLQEFFGGTQLKSVGKRRMLQSMAHEPQRMCSTD